MTFIIVWGRGCLCHDARGEARADLRELALSFHHAGPKNQTEVKNAAQTSRVGVGGWDEQPKGKFLALSELPILCLLITVMHVRQVRGRGLLGQCPFIQWLGYILPHLFMSPFFCSKHLESQ